MAYNLQLSLNNIIIYYKLRTSWKKYRVDLRGRDEIFITSSLAITFDRRYFQIKLHWNRSISELYVTIYRPTQIYVYAKLVTLYLLSDSKTTDKLISVTLFPINRHR